MAVPIPSDPELLALHAVRVRSVASDGDIAAALGLRVDEAADRLAVLAAAGLVRAHSGALPGWSLTAQGRARGERLLADEVDAAAVRPAVEAAYRSFRELNPDLLKVCTDWQLRSGPAGLVVNDHRDDVHDDGVVARLIALHGRVVPVLGDLAGALDRFAGYEPRLANALDRVRAGSRDWFTKPTIDSYHTVWFELHEDLLATLGLDRASETSEE